MDLIIIWSRLNLVQRLRTRAQEERRNPKNTARKLKNNLWKLMSKLCKTINQLDPDSISAQEIKFQKQYIMVFQQYLEKGHLITGNLASTQNVK